jgi:hypothetical protein
VLHETVPSQAFELRRRVDKQVEVYSWVQLLIKQRRARDEVLFQAHHHQRVQVGEQVFPPLGVRSEENHLLNLRHPRQVAHDPVESRTQSLLVLLSFLGESGHHAWAQPTSI